MSTYRLALNPKRYLWEDFQAKLDVFRRGDIESPR